MPQRMVVWTDNDAARLAAALASFGIRVHLAGEPLLYVALTGSE